MMDLSMADMEDKSPYAPPETPVRPMLDWKTWSPSQSDEVRQILAHVTPAEQWQLTKSSMLFGLCSGLTLSLPVTMLMYGLFAGARSHLLIAGAIVLLAAHVIYMPIWVHRQKRLLCDTQWAQDHNFTPDNLPFRKSDQQVSL